jgi:hypothetical protein
MPKIRILKEKLGKRGIFPVKRIMRGKIKNEPRMVL